MSDKEIKDVLRHAYRAAEGEPPPFDKVWAAAERQIEASSRQRSRIAGGMAAAVLLVAMTVLLWQQREAPPGDDYLIADALMNSTSWTAPSDMLLPEHQFDIYREVPALVPSTNSQEGSLL
jgi:hypothetical protein